MGNSGRGRPGRLQRALRAALLAVLAGAVFPQARAQNLFKLDSFDEREDKGIFSRSSQKRLDSLAIMGVVGLSLFEGTENRLGRASWQALDAGVTSAVTTELMKRAFGRPRPSQNPDPSVWFAGSGNRSFPSGEVTLAAAVVTPFVLEYGHDHPAVYALELIPLYDAVARMKTHGHWQTDVLAGWALGTAVGYYSHSRHESFTVGVLPRGITVGWKAKF